MAGLDYPNIEPLGGHKDKGRDALFVSRTEAKHVTIFSYTVRQDWENKLYEDCEKVRKHKHPCNAIVYVCTASLTANDKDRVAFEVHKKFGWQLIIYDLERLRVQLTGPLRHLISRHPGIFCPPWFQARGGVSIAYGKDLLVIDHSATDHALATWLSRKLPMAGYSTWCLGTAPLAGENADETVRTLITNRAIRYLPVLSPAAISDNDFISRCGLAANQSDFIIPCVAVEFNKKLLATKLQNLTPAIFENGWAVGLKALLEALESQGVQRTVDAERGESFALRSFVPEPVTISKPETLYTNEFPIIEIPNSICLYRSKASLDATAITEMRSGWAFCEVSPNSFLSFHRPPSSLDMWNLQHSAEWLWKDCEKIFEKRTYDVVKELLRRCMDLSCHQCGLKWCEQRQLFYFPEVDGPQRNLPYTQVDGSKTRVGVTGLRQSGYGDRAKQFKYQLAPRFRIGRDTEGKWWITTRLYVRVTELDGTPFIGKSIASKRKTVTRSWWNQHWLARTLGVMQFFADACNEIVISDGVAKVVVSTTPLSWDCPVSIDSEAVERIGDFQEEMASLRFTEEDSLEEAEDE
jgi:hypothetical protein